MRQAEADFLAGAHRGIGGRPSTRWRAARPRRGAPSSGSGGIALYYAGRYDDCRRQFERAPHRQPERRRERGVAFPVRRARRLAGGGGWRRCCRWGRDPRRPHARDLRDVPRADVSPGCPVRGRGAGRRAVLRGICTRGLHHEAWGAHRGGAGGDLPGRRRPFRPVRRLHAWPSRSCIGTCWTGSAPRPWVTTDTPADAGRRVCGDAVPAGGVGAEPAASAPGRLDAQPAHSVRPVRSACPVRPSNVIRPACCIPSIRGGRGMTRAGSCGGGRRWIPSRPAGQPVEPPAADGSEIRCGPAG